MAIRTFPTPVLPVLACLIACSGAGSDGSGTSLGAADAGRDAASEELDAGAPQDSLKADAQAERDAGGDIDGSLVGDDAGDDAGANLAAAQIAALSGLRWELPCIPPNGNPGCSAADPDPRRLTMPGSDGALYDVRLRFRGVVELKRYTDRDGNAVTLVPGTDTLVENPIVPNDGNNVYTLEVSDPPLLLALNAGDHQPYCQALDASYTAQIRAGAVITLFAAAADGAEVINIDSTGRPIVIDGVAPAPAAFDGQFVQVDVVELGPAAP